MDDLVTARMTITQYLNSDGHPCVEVDTDDGSGNEVSMIESLGMLSFATAEMYARFDRPEGETSES